MSLRMVLFAAVGVGIVVVVVLVEARTDGAGKLIQVRSASRSGHSDLGVNRRRVESIRAALEKP